MTVENFVAQAFGSVFHHANDFRRERFMDQQFNALCEAPNVVRLRGVAANEQNSPPISEATPTTGETAA
tara:strand:+ start:691 stop:897 length:207 start_codon:yes stop_codon:yes gene_type:complete